MNISLNEEVYIIAEKLRGELGDDMEIDLRELKHLYHNTRATLLRQLFQRRQSTYIDDIYTQTLNDIELEVIDSSLVATLPSGNKMIRTNVTIPQTIDRPGKVGTFKRIGPADRLAERYDVVSYERALRTGNGRFNSDQIVSFLLDNRIYLYSKSGLHLGLQYIDVVGVFQNPSEVAKFNDSNGNSLYSDDGEYPISRTMANTIQAMIFEQHGVPSISNPTDKVNDADNDNE